MEREQERKTRFLCIVFTMLERKILAFLSFFLSVPHSRAQAHRKDKMRSNQSCEYPLCCKRGEGNDWCIYELKFNWRTQLSVIAAIHQLDPETPLFQKEKERRWRTTHILLAVFLQPCMWTNWGNLNSRSDPTGSLYTGYLYNLYKRLFSGHLEKPNIDRNGEDWLFNQQHQDSFSFLFFFK